MSRVLERLEQVGLSPELAGRLPHQISGGERQRIALARALAVDPELLILDEPTSALDLPTRLRIVDLLDELQHLRGLTYVIIAHDLGWVGGVCDQIAVMQEGRIVDRGETSEVLTGATGAVTRDLIAASPMWKGAGRRGNTGM